MSRFWLLDAQEEHIDAVTIALPASERTEVPRTQYDIFVDGQWKGFEIANSGRVAAKRLLKQMNITKGRVQATRVQDGHVVLTATAEEILR